MAVAGNELCGSIGGGVMEVTLVERGRSMLSASNTPLIVDQVHRENSPSASGMICSGEQTVILKVLTTDDVANVDRIVSSLETRDGSRLSLTSDDIYVLPPEGGTQSDSFYFDRRGETDFTYVEQLGKKNDLYIVGGGHCSLALSELMSRMDFQIHIFDDRPELNTIGKNAFADQIEILANYELIGGSIPDGENVYIVVMTLGYKSDELVVRKLIDKDVRYLGVLGSKAKMGTMLKRLRSGGLDTDRLARIRTPIGVPINSHTPEEIAISIAAEIISVKNT